MQRRWSGIVTTLRHDTIEGSTTPALPATFLFVDIARFTAFTEEHGDETAADLAARLRTEVDVGVDVFVVDRVAYHAGLRQILATYLGVEYASVDVCHDADGKPYVDGGPPFSLSDSGDLALIAVGNDVPIGVDIEQIRVDRPVERLAQRFFSPYEREALRPLSGEELVEAFYWCWTAKEAYLKALGVGLRRSLDSFDISVDLTERPVLLADRQAVCSYPWTLCRLAVADGYAATLAVAAATCEVRQMHFTPHPIT